MSYYMSHEVFGVLSPQSLFSYVPCFSRLLKRYKSGIYVRYFDLAARVIVFYRYIRKFRSVRGCIPGKRLSIIFAYF